MAIHQNTAFQIKESEMFQADWVVRECETSGKEFRSLQRRLTSRDYQWISNILSFHIDGVRSLTGHRDSVGRHFTFSSCSLWSEAKASAAWPRRSKMSPNLDGCNGNGCMTRFKELLRFISWEPLRLLSHNIWVALDFKHFNNETRGRRFPPQFC